MSRETISRCHRHKQLARRLCAALVLGLAALGANPAAAETAVTSARVEAVVVSYLSFFKVDDLVFGNIIASSTPGTVVLAPNGARTRTGGVTLASGATARPATFAGRGTNNQRIAISVSHNSVTLTRVGGGGTMAMDTFIIGSTPTAQLTTSPLAFRINSPTGMFQFPVGATLRVKAKQAPGVYVGTYAVTVQYQ